MHSTTAALTLAGLLAMSIVNDTKADTTTIDIAGHKVPVVAGGLYDRYRSNPPLSVIQAAAPELDLSWFRTLPKTRVDVGFETYSPNFYYKNRRITAIFTADLERLRELMPAQVKQAVQPLQLWPGRGVVALTAYAYEVCDNDSYNEISLSIVTNKPGSFNFGPISLLRQSMADDYWGYVLKLPVNTELARVRGVVGYNLPKWTTGIDIRENDKTLAFAIADSGTGKTDVVFEGRKLPDLSNEVTLVKNSFTNTDRQDRLTSGYAVSRQLQHASSKEEEAVTLRLGEGSLSAYIKALKLGKMLKYEYVPDFQSALYAPAPLALASEGK
jgi:hypothetical protein